MKVRSFPAGAAASSHSQAAWTSSVTQEQPSPPPGHVSNKKHKSEVCDAGDK